MSHPSIEAIIPQLGAIEKAISQRHKDRDGINVETLVLFQLLSLIETTVSGYRKPHKQKPWRDFSKLLAGLHECNTLEATDKACLQFWNINAKLGLRSQAIAPPGTATRVRQRCAMVLFDLFTDDGVAPTSHNRPYVHSSLVLNHYDDLLNLIFVALLRMLPSGMVYSTLSWLWPRLWVVKRHYLATFPKSTGQVVQFLPATWAALKKQIQSLSPDTFPLPASQSAPTALLIGSHGFHKQVNLEEPAAETPVSGADPQNSCGATQQAPEADAGQESVEKTTVSLQIPVHDPHSTQWALGYNTPTGDHWKWSVGIYAGEMRDVNMQPEGPKAKVIGQMVRRGEEPEWDVFTNVRFIAEEEARFLLEHREKILGYFPDIDAYTYLRLEFPRWKAAQLRESQSGLAELLTAKEELERVKAHNEATAGVIQLLVQALDHHNVLEQHREIRLLAEVVTSLDRLTTHDAQQLIQIFRFAVTRLFPSVAPSVTPFPKPTQP